MKITIECEEQVLLALGVSPEEFEKELALLSAVKLYELGRLSVGAAATLAGLPKSVFLMKLAGYGVNTFIQTKAEIEQDVANARGRL